MDAGRSRKTKAGAEEDSSRRAHSQSWALCPPSTGLRFAESPHPQVRSGGAHRTHHVQLTCVLMWTATPLHSAPLQDAEPLV